MAKRRNKRVKEHEKPPEFEMEFGFIGDDGVEYTVKKGDPEFQFFVELFEKSEKSVNIQKQHDPQ
jgi:riboflavin synthase alpha subunit